MAFKFNPLTGELDLVGGAENGVKLQWHLASLDSLDKTVDITYADLGLRTQRINSVVFASSSDSTVNVTKTITYSDVGTMNQRIATETYTGSVFLGDTIIKTHNYSLNGIKYILTDFEYSIL